MVAEVEVVQHVYDMVASVRVLLPQLVQYPNLDEGLMVEALLVADDLDCDVLLGFVVQRPDHLSEAALADNLQDLVPVADVVVHNLKTNKKAKESNGKYVNVSICQWSGLPGGGSTPFPPYLLIASVLVIETRVRADARLGVDFACVQAEIVNFLVLFDFLLFEVCQVYSMVIERFCNRMGERRETKKRISQTVPGKFALSKSNADRKY